MKLFTGLFFLKGAMSQGLMIPGSQVDEHNCVLDGGYSWCESSQKCMRPWEEYCPESCEECLRRKETDDSSIQCGNVCITDYCEASNIQMCRMACAEPECSANQCAMRNGNCCDYICVNNRIQGTLCPNSCPAPAPCPMPEITNGCRYVPPIPNNCGCSIGCGSGDCSFQNKIQEGGTCGGYMPYGGGICDDGLECVYTMGPMVADASGTCEQICNTVRDTWGNCIDEGCTSWFDGCNTCSVDLDEINSLICTEVLCYGNPGNSQCLENSNNPKIPRNCLTWYDGCNTCSVLNGELQGCTLMMCFTQNEPYCQVYTTGKLHTGDLCYRFCEDNSQTFIDRRSDCPRNTECQTESVGVSFDNCGERAKHCIANKGH